MMWLYGIMAGVAVIFFTAWVCSVIAEEYRCIRYEREERRIDALCDIGDHEYLIMHGYLMCRRCNCKALLPPDGTLYILEIEGEDG